MKNNKKALALATLTACMLMLAACGKSEEIAADETSSNLKQEEQENAIQEATEAAKTDLAESEEEKNDEGITEKEGVPWDDMLPVNVKEFPAGITGSVDENNVFFPDILFPSGYTVEDGICRASLGGNDYNAFAYVETHARTIADGGGLYFEQVGDFIIYTKDIVNNIEIKDTAHNCLMHISVEIFGADDAFMSEYLLKNCEYIKQQITEWDQESVPDVEENIIYDAGTSGTSDNDGLLECDIIPCGFYNLDGNKYVIISTYDDDFSGECMVLFGRHDGAESPFDYYDLEIIENNTYSATNWDKVSVTVTFSDGCVDISGGTGELEEYNGHYTLQ